MLHTPGPWRFQDDNTFSTLGDKRIVGANLISPAIVFGGIGECEGNARLIAAAPDLYAALRAVLDRYTDLVNSGDCGHWNPEGEAEVIAARAALLRVEGGR